MVLRWTTASETDNYGFAVEHRTAGREFGEIGFVHGQGTSDNKNAYRFDVTGLAPGIHAFRLRQIDFDGVFAYSEVVEATVSIPNAFVLEPAYPNPFNPTTSLRFAVGTRQEVVVTLTDATGRLVRQVFRGVVGADEVHSLEIDGAGLASGVYQVTLVGERFKATERITLLK